MQFVHMFYMERIPPNTLKISENSYEMCWAPAQSEPLWNITYASFTLKRQCPVLYQQLLFLNFPSVPLCVLRRVVVLCRWDRAVYHPITPPALEDCLIRQRIRVCWKNEVYRSTQTLSLLSWAGCLATNRERRWWGDKCKTCCLFIHTHEHRELWKRNTTVSMT